MGKYKNELLRITLNSTLYLGLLFIFLMGFSISNSINLVGISRVTAVISATFLLVFSFMASIYGGFQIGEEKSRQIIYPIGVAVFFSSGIVYVLLLIMNVGLRDKSLFGLDNLMRLLLIIVAQVIYLIALTYLGNYFYFSMNSEKSVVVIDNEFDSKKAVVGHIKKYKKQYKSPVEISLDVLDIEQDLCNYDIIVALNLKDDDLTNLVNYAYCENKQLFITQI